MFRPSSLRASHRLPGILFSFCLVAACACAGILAAPVRRPLIPGPLPIHAAAEWDLDQDGVVDLVAESSTMMTNSIPGSTYENVRLMPRAGVDLLVADASPGSPLLRLSPLSPVGPVLAQGAWWVGGSQEGLSLGGSSQYGNEAKVYYGPFANVRSGWIGFRLQRQGHTYYGALQGGPVPSWQKTLLLSSLQPGFVLASEQTGALINVPVVPRKPVWPPSNWLPPHNLHAVILESEPDTPVAVTSPFVLVTTGVNTELPENSSMDFGASGIGIYQRQRFTILNTTDAPLTGLSLILEGAHAADFALSQPVISELAPGATAEFYIGFSPSLAGNRQGILSIRRGSEDSNPFTLFLHGMGDPAPARLTVHSMNTSGPVSLEPLTSSSLIDFGRQPLGATTIKNFRIFNHGGQIFKGSIVFPSNFYGTIIFPRPNFANDPSIQPPQDGFSIRSGGEIVIQPGQFVDFQVVWHSVDVTPQTRWVQINDSRGYSQLSVGVTGSAQRAVPVEQQVTFHLGDSQPGSMVSGAPVTHEIGLVPGDPNSWTDLSGYVHADVLGYYFGFNPVSALPSKVPRRHCCRFPPGGAVDSPRGSQAALHFDSGECLEQNDFSMPQFENVGMQIWVRAAAAVGTHPVVHLGGAAAGRGFGIWQVDGVWRGRMADGAWVGEATVAPGTWQHLALVRRGGVNTLYLNGHPAGATSTALLFDSPLGAYIVRRPSGLQLGGAFSTGTSAYSGDVDELQLFTLNQSAPFNAETDLMLGAAPDLKCYLTPDSATAMIGQTKPFYVQLINSGGGAARVTPRSLTGAAAADYTLMESVTGTWSDGAPGGPSGAFSGFDLAPGEKRLLQLTFSPSAEGSRPATLRLETNSPSLPVVDLSINGSGEAATPRLLVSGTYPAPGQLQFGSVLVDSTQEKSLYVYNAGSQPLTGIQVDLVGADPQPFTIRTWPLRPVTGNSVTVGTLAPQQWIFLGVAYQPSTTAAHEALLEITSDDPAARRQSIVLSGHGVQRTPDIEVTSEGTVMSTPTLLGFQSTMVGGGTFWRDVQVANRGSAPLTIQDIAVVGAGSAQFGLVPALPGAGTLTIEPGSFISFRVVFKPTVVGTSPANLEIATNDPDESPFEIALVGQGVVAEPELTVRADSVVLPPNQSFVSVGEAAPGSTTAVKTFTITNDGFAPLAGLSVTKTGAYPQEFELGALSTTTVQPGASATFTVRFRPHEIGPMGATILLASSDTDEAVTKILVGGTCSYGEVSLLRPEREGWTGTAMAETAQGTLLLAGFTTHPVTQARSYEVRRIARDGSEKTLRMSQPDGEVRALALSIQPLLQNGVQPCQCTTNTASAGQADIVWAGGHSLLTGSFTHVGLTPRQGIARLNPDGTLDTSFVPPSGDFAGRTVVALPDGKVLVGGSGSLGGRANLIRLNFDGSLDTTFVLTAPDAAVTHLALQDDGRILMAGNFMNYPLLFDSPILLGESGVGVGCLRRLNADGTLDFSFGITGRMAALATRGERIFFMQTRAYFSALPFLGGFPYSLNFRLADTLVAVRLDGTQVSSQQIGDVADATQFMPRTLAVQPDGDVLLAPGPSFWGSSGGLQQISRYHADCQVDPSFYAVLGDDADVKALHVQADGKVLAAGDFTGVNRWTSIMLYGSSQRVPTTGQPGFGDGGPAAGFAQLSPIGDYRPDIRATVINSGAPVSDGLSTLEFFSTADEEVVIPVNLESYFSMMDDSGAAPVPNLVPIFEGAHAADFSVEVTATPSFQEPSWRNLQIAIHFRPGGPGVREARLRLTLASIIKYGYNFNPLDIRLHGFNGSWPKLQVLEENALQPIQSGQVIDLGEIMTGSTVIRSYTLRNAGSAPDAGRLENLDVQLVGPQASAFEIISVPLGALEPQASAPLVIRCTPGVEGLVSATVEVRSSDPQVPVFRWILRAYSREAISVTDGPQDRIAGVGQTVLFTAAEAAATGTAAHATTYQWLKNGRPVAGAVQRMLILRNVTLADAGAYTLQIRSGTVKTLSPKARLAVVVDVAESAAFVSGKPLILTVKTAGEGLAFQWYKDGAALTAGARVAGTRSSRLVLPKPAAADAGRYTCGIILGTVQRMTEAIDVRPMQAPALVAMDYILHWTVGIEVSEQLQQTGDAASFIVTGMPPGVRLHADTGRLSGRPTAAGSFILKAKAANAAGISEVRTVMAEVSALPLVGEYAGLLEHRAGLFQGKGGRLTLLVNSAGGVTGSLTTLASAVQPVTFRFTGAVQSVAGDDAAGLVRILIQMPNLLPPIELTCDINTERMLIKVDGDDAGTGGRKLRASEMSGTFTASMESSDFSSAGFARLGISARGVLVWAGKLASENGVRSMVLSADLVAQNGSRRFPVYSPLGNQETVSAWLVTDAGRRYLDGESGWWNAPVALGAWPGGNAELNIVGSEWVPPSALRPFPARRSWAPGGETRISFGNGAIQLVQIDQAYRILPRDSRSWPTVAQGGILRTAVLNVTTGTFSGGTWGQWAGRNFFTAAGAQVPFGTFEGVLVARQHRGVGIFTPMAKSPLAPLAMPVLLEPTNSAQ